MKEEECCGYLGLSSSWCLEEQCRLPLCSSQVSIQGKEKGAVYLLVPDPCWSGPSQEMLIPSHFQAFDVAKSKKQPCKSKMPGIAEAGAARLLLLWLVDEKLGQKVVRKAWKVSRHPFICFCLIFIITSFASLALKFYLDWKFSCWSITRSFVA